MASETTTIQDGTGQQAAAIVLGLIAVVIFAGTLPATRHAVTELSPAFVTLGRAALAGLMAIAALAITRSPLPPRRDLLRFAGVAACLTLGFPFLLGLAMLTVPSAHGGVVIAIMPVAVTACAALFGNEKPGPRFWALSVLGAAIVLVYTASHAGWSVRTGDIFLVLGSIVAAIGYTLSGRLARGGGYAGWQVISWALVLALPFHLVGTVAVAPAEPPQSISVMAAFAYLGVFSMFLGFFFFNQAMARGGIAKIGQLQLIQPFFTLAIAAVLLGEAIQLDSIVFAILVVVVVAAAQRQQVITPT